VSKKVFKLKFYHILPVHNDMHAITSIIKNTEHRRCLGRNLGKFTFFVPFHSQQVKHKIFIERTYISGTWWPVIHGRVVSVPCKNFCPVYVTVNQSFLKPVPVPDQHVVVYLVGSYQILTLTFNIIVKFSLHYIFQNCPT